MKLKPLVIAVCSLLLVFCALAAPEDEPNASAAHRSEWAHLLQQGEQMKASVGEKTDALLMQALGFLGVPYKRGGSSPEIGFDCSGFVRHLYENSIGHLLPRRAQEQAQVTEKIDRSDLHPGDLVFFNTMRRTFSHVGIYLGDGKFIHAPSTGNAVRVDDLRAAYWSRRFTGARRVPNAPGADPQTP